MLSMPNVCHEFFRVPTMTEGFLEQVLILLFLKKKKKKQFGDRKEGEVILRGRKNRGKGRG